jgi:hypothetical protein
MRTNSLLKNGDWLQADHVFVDENARRDVRVSLYSTDSSPMRTPSVMAP